MFLFDFEADPDLEKMDLDPGHEHFFKIFLTEKEFLKNVVFSLIFMLQLDEPWVLRAKDFFPVVCLYFGPLIQIRGSADLF